MRNSRNRGMGMTVMVTKTIRMVAKSPISERRALFLMDSSNPAAQRASETVTRIFVNTPAPVMVSVSRQANSRSELMRAELGWAADAVLSGSMLICGIVYQIVEHDKKKDRGLNITFQEHIFGVFYAEKIEE
jgi:hypothetical protein